MENVPVEVIGNILSLLGGARDVIIASATCRKWREARRKHLQTLSFNSNECPMYRDLTTRLLEILITQTIFQTTGLQGLSILMDEADEFSASTVIAWLMYTRENLRRLFYNVRTNPSINILEICGRQKLEMLFLAHNSIIGVEPSFQSFPCLKSLSLSRVNISVPDLNLLLSGCPKLEELRLVRPEIQISDAVLNVELCSPTLKTIYVEAFSFDKFTLEADCIELLHLRDCALEDFELIGKGTLKHFKIDDVSVLQFDMGDIDNLETVEVSNFTIVWPKLLQMISRSSNLRKLRLWKVAFDEDLLVDLQDVAVSFPQLCHLALRYDWKDSTTDYELNGFSNLENLILLELGWTDLNYNFPLWVEALLKRCPNLKKLIISGVVSGSKTHAECQVFASFTLFMVQLMRKYLHIEVQFEYD